MGNEGSDWLLKQRTNSKLCDCQPSILFSASLLPRVWFVAQCRWPQRGLVWNPDSQAPSQPDQIGIFFSNKSPRLTRAHSKVWKRWSRAHCLCRDDFSKAQNISRPTTTCTCTCTSKDGELSILPDWKAKPVTMSLPSGVRVGKELGILSVDQHWAMAPEGGEALLALSSRDTWNIIPSWDTSADRVHAGGKDRWWGDHRITWQNGAFSRSTNTRLPG